jgi:hypothetical protein
MYYSAIGHSNQFINILHLLFVKERPVPQYVSLKLRDDGRNSLPKHVVIVNNCTIFMVLSRSRSENRYHFDEQNGMMLPKFPKFNRLQIYSCIILCFGNVTLRNTYVNYF